MVRRVDNAFVLWEGKISNYVSFSLGIVSLLAVLAFLLPEYLTTPDLRQHYPVDLLRRVLMGTLILSFLFGLLSFVLTRKNGMAKWGILLSTIAILLGGSEVEIKEYQDNAFQIGLDWLILDLLILSVIFIPIERIFPRRKDQLTLRGEWKTDLTYFAISHLLIQLTAFIVQQPATLLFGWIGLLEAQAWVVELPLMVQVVAALFLTDLVQYAVHRSFHASKFLWPFHEVHHSIKELDWLSGSRIHIVDALVTRSLAFIPLYVFGFSSQAFGAYIVFVAFQTILIHSNTDIRFGLLKYLVVTPQYHHWHHSSDPETYGKNFAVHFPLIDFLFGTYYLPEDQWPGKYGVGDDYPDGFFKQFVHPFRRKNR